MTWTDTTRKLERAKGFEPSTALSQPAQRQAVPQFTSEGYTQIRAQISPGVCRDLPMVINAWAFLSRPLKAAILALVDSALGGKEKGAV